MAMSDKNDVFVGNVTFNTTEEQLREIFSFVGPVRNVRILTDKDSGRPKGFAFIEYNDANTALAAIRRLDQTELNGRKLRVSYSNNSNLKELARSIGQDVTETTAAPRGDFQAVTSLSLADAWEILDAMKTLADDEKDKGNKARILLESNPNFVQALQQIQKKLGIFTSASASTLPTSIASGLPNSSAGFSSATLSQAPTLGGSSVPNSGGYPQYNAVPHGNPPSGFYQGGGPPIAPTFHPAERGGRDWDRERDPFVPASHPPIYQGLPPGDFYEFPRGAPPQDPRAGYDRGHQGSGFPAHHQHQHQHQHPAPHHHRGGGW